MGALGSDAAIEAADVVLMDDKPSKIALAIRLSRRTIFIAKENAWFAIGIKVGGPTPRNRWLCKHGMGCLCRCRRDGSRCT